MNIPCPNRLDCPGTDSPVSNLTSEKPDQEIFIGFNTGWGWNFPLLGSEWARSNCLGVCTSTVSQADADLCAAMANLQCLVTTWGPPGDGDPTSGPPVIIPSTPAKIYTSQSQVCLLSCPDGSPFIYGIPAGYVSALSQQQANAIAYSQACYLGSKAILCLSSINSHACKGDAYSSFIVSSRGPVIYSIASGSLPPGITAVQTAKTAFRISGLPTVPGNYQFTVRADASGGVFMQKTYTLHVLGISPTTMPDATQGNFYTVSFTPTGFDGNITFSMYSGVLPGGLTLDANGTISGTPTETGDFTFFLRVTDSNQGSCIVQYSLHVEPGECPDWTAMTWTPATLFGGTIVDATFGPGAFFNIDLQVPAGGAAFVADAVGSLPYAGPGCNCRATVTYTHQDAVEHGGAGFQIFQDAVLIMDWNISTHGLGTHTEQIDFTVNPSAGSVIRIKGRYFDFIRLYYSFATPLLGVPGVAKYNLSIVNI